MKKFIQFVTLFFTSKIRNRLLVLLLFCTLTPVVLVSLVSYFNATNAIESQFVNSNLKLIDYVNVNLDEYLKTTEELTLSFIKDEELMKKLTSTIGGRTELISPNFTYVENQLFNLMNKSRDIDSAFFYVNSIDRLYYVPKSTLGVYIVEKPIIGQEPWYKNAINPDNHIYRQDAHLYSFNIKSKNPSDDISPLLAKKPKTVLTFSHALRNFPSDELLGVVSLNINIQSLSRLYKKAIVSKSEKVYIANEAGMIIYCEEPDKICDSMDENIISNIDKKSVQGSSRIEIDNTKYLMLHSLSSFSNWLIIKLIPINELNIAVHQSSRITFIVVLVFTVLVVVISLFLSYSISGPVVQLARFMKSVKGDNLLNLKHSNRKDEIGVLFSSFNEMVDKINFLIQEEYKSRIREKNAQIKALQSQINPHFLYNTLQTISSMAIAANALEINEAIKALGAMFRYAIKSDIDIVTIEEEIGHVMSYFTIQKLRFGQRLEYNIYIPEKMLGQSIPKLTLQPIVENAIVHGLEGRVTGGKVEISGWEDEEYSYIQVTDTGCGINAIELENLRRLVSNDTDILSNRKGLGLRNVNARLIYAFNKECGISIMSDQGKSTFVVIKLVKHYNREESI